MPASYVDAVRTVGGRPVLLPPGDEDPAALLDDLDGVLLCGGGDVDPALFGGPTGHEAQYSTCPERDAFELALVHQCLARRMPTLAICRGLQVVNVYLGGSLWQDLPSQRPSAVDHSVAEPKDILAHTVRVLDPGAPIAERLTGDSRVNSRHHQAIKRLANGLLPVAESPDGLIEAAVLADSGWWVRGVQWHPENLIALDPQRALWTDFVRALEK